MAKRETFVSYQMIAPRSLGKVDGIKQGGRDGVL